MSLSSTLATGGLLTAGVGLLLSLVLSQLQRERARREKATAVLDDLKQAVSDMHALLRLKDEQVARLEQINSDLNVTVTNLREKNDELVRALIEHRNH